MATKRRGHGEGTIFQRGSDGRWCAQLSLPGGRRKTFMAHTRADVARRLAEATRDRDKGLPIVGERVTVGRYLTDWLEVKQQRVDVATVQAYSTIIRLHLAPTLGKVVLSRLTPQQATRLYAQKLAAGLAPQTVNHMHVVLKAALHDAQKLSLVQRNVLDLVDAPRFGRTEMHPLTAEQATAFLHALDGERLYALFVLAIHTGMRQGELLALTWRDVDLDARRLTVRTSLQRAPGHKQIKQPKTTGSRRGITLTALAAEALRAHRARQLTERLAAREWEDHDLVFPSATGRLGCHSTAVTAHKRALRAAGLPDIRFHDLRHTCATLLLLQGVHPKVVSEMLGHASVAITLAVYAHVLPTMQDSAALALDRLFA